MDYFVTATWYKQKLLHCPNSQSKKKKKCNSSEELKCWVQGTCHPEVHSWILSESRSVTILSTTLEWSSWSGYKYCVEYSCFCARDTEIDASCSRDVNTTIMELLIMVYACKTSCAKSIIGVIPYFPYSKQCKMRKRGSIVSKLLASMMCKAGKNAGCYEIIRAMGAPAVSFQV